MPLWRYLATSLFLVIANIVLTVFACSLVAYSFARLRWPGRDRRSIVRTVDSGRMTLMRLAMGLDFNDLHPHYIHTPYVCQMPSIAHCSSMIVL